MPMLNYIDTTYTIKIIPGEDQTSAPINMQAIVDTAMANVVLETLDCTTCANSSTGSAERGYLAPTTATSTAGLAPSSASDDAIATGTGYVLSNKSTYSGKKGTAAICIYD